MRLAKPKESCRLFAVYSNVGSFIVTSEGQTIRKLMRGRAKYQKKYSREGKLNEKKHHARQLILKNIHAMA